MDIFQPPPLYPQLSTKPLTLDPNERYAELIKLKRKLINDSKRSPFYFENINPDRSDFNSTIQRYSDRYLKQKRVDSAKWNIDWKLLPKELKYFYEKSASSKNGKRKTKSTSSGKGKKPKKIDLDDKLDEILTREDENEEEENEDNEDEKPKNAEKNTDDEDENQDLENADEEEVEEDNDYIDTYFDNGEDYADDDGGGDDEGPVY